jgi:RNA 2',3'-cyclic 3'-phosphodiesterase
MTRRSESEVGKRGDKAGASIRLIRTFVAFMIPTDWTEYLGEIGRDLAARTSRFSWVKPGNIHITIRFLGDLGEDGVRRVSESVRESAGSAEAPRARLGALGAFPKLEKPRVVWVGLGDGADAVTSLGKTVNDALKRDGFGPPDKPFRPHLTLARVREGAGGLDALHHAVIPPPPPAAFLDRICVMKSELHPAGARYTALTEVRLRLPGGSAPTSE